MNLIIFVIILFKLISINIINGFENINGNNFLIERVEKISFNGNFNFSNDFGKISGEGICFSGVGGGFNVLEFSSSLGNSEIFIIKREEDFYFEEYDHFETCKHQNEISDLYVKPNQKLKNKSFYFFLEEKNYYNGCFNIYLKNCDIKTNQKNDSISYEIEILKIHSPLNINHSTIASFHIFFIIFFILIFIISIFNIYILKQKKIKGDIIIMFSFVLILSIVGHSIYLSNWNFQLNNMIEINGRILLGNIFTFTSNSLFSLLITNICQGWGLIPNYGKNLGMISNVAILFSTEILGLSAYLVESNSEIYGGEYRNPFKSNVGYVLIIIQGLTIFYFIFSNKIFSNMNSSDQYQKSFLIKFKTIFSIWIISIPILEIISIFIVDNNFRFTLFSIINDSFNLIFYLLIIYIYHPCKSNILVKRLNSYYDEDELSINQNQSQQKSIDEINLENLYNK
ncbi:hypothetical protein ACTFIZ_009250 [Dictyostelium cf. discoideum]